MRVLKGSVLSSQFDYWLHEVIKTINSSLGWCIFIYVTRLFSMALSFSLLSVFHRSAPSDGGRPTRRKSELKRGVVCCYGTINTATFPRKRAVNVKRNNSPAAKPDRGGGVGAAGGAAIDCLPSPRRPAPLWRDKRTQIWLTCPFFKMGGFKMKHLKPFTSSLFITEMYIDFNRHRI